MTVDGHLMLKAKLTVGAIAAIVSTVFAFATTFYTNGSRDAAAAAQRDLNTAEIRQEKSLSKDRDTRIDELTKLVVGGFAKLNAQMELILPRVFPSGKTTFFGEPPNMHLVVDSAEQAPFELKQPKAPSPSLQEKIVALENLRERITALRAAIDQHLAEEQQEAPPRAPEDDKLSERRKLEREYELSKTQEIRMLRELLNSGYAL